MKTLELTIRCTLTVDDATADALNKSSTGFLRFSDQPFGSERLTVGPMNGPHVEPSHMDIKLVEVSDGS